MRFSPGHAKFSVLEELKKKKRQARSGGFGFIRATRKVFVEL